MGRKLVDLTGQIFGKLTVIERANDFGHGSQWKVRCECGNVRIVRSSDLQKGDTGTRCSL